MFLFTKRLPPNALCNMFQSVSERRSDSYNTRNLVNSMYSHAELISDNFQCAFANQNSSILFPMTFKTLTVL